MINELLYDMNDVQIIEVHHWIVIWHKWCTNESQCISVSLDLALMVGSQQGDELAEGISGVHSNWPRIIQVQENLAQKHDDME